MNTESDTDTVFLSGLWFDLAIFSLHWGSVQDSHCLVSSQLSHTVSAKIVFKMAVFIRYIMLVHTDLLDFSYVCKNYLIYVNNTTSAITNVNSTIYIIIIF